METPIRPVALTRSISLPARPKPALRPSQEGEAAAAQNATRRALTVSFAPAPLDETCAAPGSPHVDIVALETPSMSAVARNFGVLAKRYQDASPDERWTAFQALTLSGSRMFADFLMRDAERSIDEAWEMKSFRRGDLRAQREKAPHSCMLGELASLSPGLGPDGRKVYNIAERRRALLYAEMQQLLQSVAEQHDLEQSPALQGTLVGCILDGAMHALLDTATSVNAHGYVQLKGSVLALCNALEDVCGLRPPGLARTKTESKFDRTMAWKYVLVQEPEHIVERCARTVSASPKGFTSNELHKSEFQNSLKRTRSAGYGERGEPKI